MTKRIVLLTVWIAIVALVLAWTLSAYETTSPALKDEILLRHGLVMSILSFPAGWVLSSVLFAVLNVFGFELFGISDAIATTLICALAGYVQWFLILPGLWARWRTRRQS